MSITGIATALIGGMATFIIGVMLMNNVITGTTTADYIFLYILPMAIPTGILLWLMRGLFGRGGDRQ